DLIEVKLRADSLESLSSYLGLDMILEGDNETGSMYFTIPSTDYYTSADSQFRETIDQIIGNSRFRISFKPPSVPINTNPGFIDGKTAVLDLSLGDILHGETVDTWVVNW
ncbi:MAG: hypothetical protein KAH21_03820, partial [Spirochaetaceae bacterium]|nr:hypothetical protein [Spirochaetaceae bacterium]